MTYTQSFDLMSTISNISVTCPDRTETLSEGQTFLMLPPYSAPLSHARQPFLVIGTFQA